MNKKILCSTVTIILIFASILPVTGELNNLTTEEIKENINNNEYPLPPPISIDMVLEETICRRMSIRGFTSEQIIDEELSTILWAAYGFTDDGKRSIFNPDEIYSTIIYVIRSDATYKYVPENHSLSLFKTGNYLYIGQYDAAPIKFGLVWDISITTDELFGMSEIGMIGQNIYFDANALNLGTVTTGYGVEVLGQVLGLPSNEKSEIIMPLGHPSPPYDFTYSPLPPSNLPSIINNTYSLENCINNRLICKQWDDTPLSDVEESQLIWSSYGYSYLLDDTNDRHRTVPSAVAIYPFKIYAANQDGVYLYNSSTHSISTIVLGDKREEINNSLGSNDIWTASATWIIIPFYNTNSYPEYLNWWYYEVGAISHNVILEATALNLSSNLITDISDVNGLRSALGISSQTNLQPWFVIPVGHPANKPPDIPSNPYPEDGETNLPLNLNLTWMGGDPDGDNVTYDIYFGTTSPPPKIVSNYYETSYNPGELTNLTTYYWQVISFDEYDASTAGPIWSFVTTFNYPPNEPTITGQAKGKPKTEYDYAFVSVDPNMDDLYYYIDWGDETNSGWIGPHHSEENIIQSHKWLEKGMYNISCKVKDIYNAESSWGFIQVTIPRDKTNINSLLLRFKEQFPLIEKLLFYKFWFSYFQYS